MGKAKVYYWQGILGDAELFAPYYETISKLVKGNYKAADLDLKQLDGYRVYSVRINKSDRLIFTTFEKDGDSYLLLLDVVLNHDYRKCPFFNRSVLKNYLVKNATDIAQQIDDSNFIDISEAPLADKESQESIDSATSLQFTPINYYNQMYIEFNDEQQIARGATLPAVISGPPGSGKSCVALSLLEQAVSQQIHHDSPILYVTQSEPLKKMLEGAWKELPIAQNRPPNSVQFCTYLELLNKLNVEYETVGKSSFKSWFKQYNTKQKHRKKTITEYENFLKQGPLIYRELRILTAYKSEEYLKLGERQSLIHEPNERQWMLEIAKAYLLYLKETKRLDPALYELQIKPVYSLIVVDEAQDLSHCQLKNLRDLTKDCQIAACMDTHQSLEDEQAKRDYLLQMLSARHYKAQNLTLSATYRCPPVIAKLANKVIDIKNILTGGIADKKEFTAISSTPDSQAEAGFVEWLDYSSTEEILKLRQKELVVVTYKEFKDEAIKLFQTPLVFTPKQIKGLEYKTVVAFRLFDKDEFQQANAQLKDKVKGGSLVAPTHRAKQGQRNSGVGPLWNKIFTTFTRTRNNLIVVQDPRQIPELCNVLQNTITNQNIPLHTALSEDSQIDWRKEAEKQRQHGNEDIARRIEEEKLNENTKLVKQDVKNSSTTSETIKKEKTTPKSLPAKGRSVAPAVEFKFPSNFSKKTLAKLLNSPQIHDYFFQPKGDSCNFSDFITKEDNIRLLASVLEQPEEMFASALEQLKKVFSSLPEQHKKIARISEQQRQLVESVLSQHTKLLESVLKNPELLSLSELEQHKKLLASVPPQYKKLLELEQHEKLLLSVIDHQKLIKRIADGLLSDFKGRPIFLELFEQDNLHNLVKYIPAIARYLPPEFLTQKYTYSEKESTIFLDLTQTSDGHEILSILFKKNPNLIKFLSLTDMTASYNTTDNFALKHLTTAPLIFHNGNASSFPNDINLLRLILKNNQKLITELSPALTKPVTHGALENTSPFFWLCFYSPPLLGEWLDVSPELITDLSTEELIEVLFSIPAPNFDMAFFFLTTDREYFSVFKRILDLKPDILAKIPAEKLAKALTLNTQGDCALYSLSKMPEGCAWLNQLLKLKPEVANYILPSDFGVSNLADGSDSTLYWLSYSTEGRLVLKTLFNLNKLLATDLKLENFIRPITGENAIKSDLNATPFYWLTTSPDGRQLLVELLDLNENIRKGLNSSDLLRMRPEEAEKYACTTALYYLTSDLLGHKVLNLLLQENPKLATEVSYAQLTQMLTGKAPPMLVNTSPFYWLVYHYGLSELLDKFLTPEIEKQLTSQLLIIKTYTSTVGAIPQTILDAFSRSRNGLQKIAQIFSNSPGLLDNCINRILVSFSRINSLLNPQFSLESKSSLLLSHEGQLIVCEKLRQDPSFAKFFPAKDFVMKIGRPVFIYSCTPLQHLCQASYGITVLTELLQANPDYIKEIPATAWTDFIITEKETGSCCIHWLARSEQGIEILAKLIQENEALVRQISNIELLRPVVCLKTKEKTTLAGVLMQSVKGRHVLQSLFKKRPELEGAMHDAHFSSGKSPSDQEKSKDTANKYLPTSMKDVPNLFQNKPKLEGITEDKSSNSHSSPAVNTNAVNNLSANSKFSQGKSQGEEIEQTGESLRLFKKANNKEKKVEPSSQPKMS
ncbi:DNA/RNA helicase domain-containing protein [Legionella hackeliae]|uniref:DNA 3'-5' helicase II n=1 Tax=Legionella hackeliae TaxID=449 RepID=A0A0A8UWP8_LEGHA|nr:DNA/RNA helicase domain-containing protein [Legionella hackeliae]KTD13162.1 hypothetical protein Lhac_1031 [Legionella hackeliae]CEK11527.1 protein of unknown function [Legionella hackeliae]STX48295.1 Uncharacterised protein [Legionella hackeliae]